MMKETILDWLDRRVANLIMICITISVGIGLPIISFGVILLALEGVLGDIETLRAFGDQAISVCGAICGIAIALLIFPLIPAHIILRKYRDEDDD